MSDPVVRAPNGILTSDLLGDFKVTRVSDTQLTVEAGRLIFFPVAAATINISAGVGTGLITIYADRTDLLIHVFDANGTLDISKISGVNIVVDPSGIPTEYQSNPNNADVYGAFVTADVFDALDPAADSRQMSGLGTLNLVYPASYATGSVLLSGAGVYTKSFLPGFIGVGIDPNGPAGLWQKWNIAVNISRGVITDYDMGVFGSGYQVNDILPVLQAGSGNDATVTVDAVDGGGAITAYSISNGGTNYTVLLPSTLTGGSGSGATGDVNVITPVPQFDVTAPDGTVTSVPIAAAFSQDITLATPFGFVSFDQGGMAVPTTAFAGTTTLLAGLVGGGSALVPQVYNLNAAGEGNYDFGPKVGTVFPTPTIQVSLLSTVENLDQLTQGSLDVYVKYSVLP